MLVLAPLTCARPLFLESYLDTLTCLLIWMSQLPTERICVEMLFNTVHIQRVQSMVPISLDMPINYHF